ncbi:DUF2599 domain-containing protein [Gordonia insulae]|uniref:DUF2599 domain-containing protein n=1 Tax=Gordonia insulae TaxID=2420509 RepID=A0A3G8JS94_9ACTN|nr:DUF2599 domain-containing protein [Gordonia insulae]AZG47957.1 hypothetical protein D7316_04569 [Gordonia insulae]
MGTLGVLGCALVSVAGCGPGDDAGEASAVRPTSTTPTVSSTIAGPVGQGTPSTTPVLPPPYVDFVEWVTTAVGPSLQVHPTAAGRRTDNPRGADIAWAEVLRLEPDADTPGMRAQFDCHWDFARAVEPDKPSWNLEPSRPVVTDQVMIETRCNPGAPEE